jgi:hypothetical protein
VASIISLRRTPFFARSSSVKYRSIIAALATSIVVAGCGGPGNQLAMTSPAHVASRVVNDDRKIESTCPRKIDVRVGSPITCFFSEGPYRGKFSIQTYSNYIFSVSPTVGKRKTPFVVTAHFYGRSSFSVSGYGGHRILIRVQCLN